jgi:hypothetical protein
MARSFSRQTRPLAQFCMALCLALSAQITLALLDRLQHAFDIDHAPSALAGVVTADISHHHSDAHHHAGSAPHHHDHDADAGDEHHGAAPHQHHSDGVLAPWLAQVAFVVRRPHILFAIVPHRLAAHPDAAARPRERPPKLVVEA